MSRAVMQQALEALEVMWRHFSSARLGEYTATDYATRNAAYAAIYQLRAALAEPQTTHWEGCEAVHPECRAIPRKPLTDEEIADLWDGHTVPVFGKTGINPIVFARAIERAHGIGEQHE